MADFTSKLNKVAAVEEPPRADLSNLTNSAGYDIAAAIFHHHQTFGSFVIVNLIVEAEERIVFLPKRFARTLCQSEVRDLPSTRGYKLRCTSVVNKSPVIDIFKS